jgi:uncharacterized membrane protein YfcA
MDVIVIIGFAAAILIGVSLGLIGGGGSILTVPVLVYILDIDPVLATAYSLFVVGSTSLVGAGTYMKKGLVNYKTALVFAIPSFIAVFLTRKFLVSALPDPLFSIGEAVITKNIGIMVFFALIMLAASYSMIFAKKCVDCEEDKPVAFNFPMIALEGSVVGVLDYSSLGTFGQIAHENGGRNLTVDYCRQVLDWILGRPFYADHRLATFIDIYWSFHHWYFYRKCLIQKNK